MLSFDVAIVNYNTRDLLRACLRSVYAETPGRVIVVDNASTDDSARMVRAEFPAAILIENPANPGYSRASNQAIAQSSAAYILLLNSDTLLAPGTLPALQQYLDRNPEVAIVGPRLLNGDGTLQQSTFPYPTPLDVFLDSTNLSRLMALVPPVRNRYLRTWAHDRDRSVPWVSGAALAIRRSAFDRVGGFDESFYMYYEEVDLCLRLVQAGWEIHFTPAACITHYGGASTQQRRAEMTVQFYASLAHFYRLHYSPLRLGLLVGLVRTVALARWVRDRISLGLSADGLQQKRLRTNMAAWQRLLLTRWESQVAHG